MSAPMRQTEGAARGSAYTHQHHTSIYYACQRNKPKTPPPIRNRVFMLCRQSAKRFYFTTSRRGTAALISSFSERASSKRRLYGSRAMTSSEDGKKVARREGHLERTADEPRDAVCFFSLCPLFLHLLSVVFSVCSVVALMLINVWDWAGLGSS